MGSFMICHWSSSLRRTDQYNQTILSFIITFLALALQINQICRMNLQQEKTPVKQMSVWYRSENAKQFDTDHKFILERVDGNHLYEQSMRKWNNWQIYC